VETRATRPERLAVLRPESVSPFPGTRFTKPARAAAPLPMTAAEVTARGWSEVDVVIVSGDAYVDHPSFAMALLGRLLESAGYRVAILSQPNWQSAEPWRTFGRPRLFFGISAGNMDSMINHYTANRSCCRASKRSPTTRSRSQADAALAPRDQPEERPAPRAEARRPRLLVVNPPALALDERGMDRVYDLPYTRKPAPALQGEPIPAHTMIKDSVHDHARLLRRLHVLLDHDAPGARRSRAAARSRSCGSASRWPPTPTSRATSATSAARPRTCTRCAARARGRGEVPAPVVRASDRLQAARHRPRADQATC
jgi:hypothetical protein